MPQDTESTDTPVEDTRTGLSVAALERAFANNLFYVQGKFAASATRNDYYMALAYTVRDRMLRRLLDAVETWLEKDAKLVCYLSAEFLTGPHLQNNLINLGIEDAVREAVCTCKYDLQALIEQEEEPGLGNGGLGRLAACYMDSLASLQIPAIGYGIRYEYGIFDQEIQDGWQVEITDKWLHLGNPWELHRPERTYEVKFGGHTESWRDEQGRYRVRWIPNRVVMGVAYDTPILGYRVHSANLLRLWSAQAPESFDFQDFNVGDYMGAVQQKMVSENITKVLYPNDEAIQGKKLRLQQQYFFVTCSLQDMIAIHLIRGNDLGRFHETFAGQLNDTHPSVAVPELMRLLMDEHGLEWEQAWHITRNTLAYTNHTLLPEALESWSLPLFREILPRHMEIIYEINRRFLDEVRLKFPDDSERLARMSLIDERGEKSIRMANLACVGSHAINGVAELHTELLREHTLRDFHEFFPERFSNKTNGVTPRRWMVLCNPRLTALISEKIGDDWITDLHQLRKLEAFVDDEDFLARWRRVKLDNKREQAAYYQQHTGIALNPEALCDVQVKRLHEYKRQHLMVLHIITLYDRIKRNPELDIVPRTFIFGGKAAPGYFMAKLIIKLINSVGDVVNNDPDVRDRLKVVFIPNFSVKLGHRVYPIADLSEQISTAGKEASGTGNMKFAMNGALTVGTLDGANVEIREEVGAENFFLFGLTAQEVMQLKQDGYNPRDYYNRNEELQTAIDRISSGFFSHGDGSLFKPLTDELMSQDQYMLLADYASYIECQDRISEDWRDQQQWTRRSILNVARMGKFSSDRSIRDYCRDIWHVEPVVVDSIDRNEECITEWRGSTGSNRSKAQDSGAEDRTVH
ncbi:MAG TPA: glycogen/starch/alpha-glucan phosphorylase [Gammaproteobacteria bacterium]|nr:glycogen/starch/alpha-glucan phosphorylase [Gammaproteobacteria bacterium]